MKFLSDLKLKDLSGRIILLRVDFNIEGGENISKNPRVLSAAGTIKFLRGKGAKVVVLSHRGRPAGKRKGERGKRKAAEIKKFSLKIFAGIISKLIKQPVVFAELDEKKMAEKIKKSKPGSVYLLENLRFWEGEDKDDKNFAKKLASLGDIYINDAFSFSHRKNASMAAITKFLPSFAGLTLENEIKNLSGVLKNPKKPLVVVLGGAKVSDKLGLINNFAKKADKFLIGGAMANTFFAAGGLPVGNSLFEPKMIGAAKRLLVAGKIILPVDVATRGREILDIGPETMKLYAGLIAGAGTIIWNGPMGKFEDKRFRAGTENLARAVFTNKKTRIIIGGGETTQAFQLKAKSSKLKANLFISTGGGAMLEYLGGKKLPALKALGKN